jgi:hypothetical protein
MGTGKTVNDVGHLGCRAILGEVEGGDNLLSPRLAFRGIAELYQGSCGEDLSGNIHAIASLAASAPQLIDIAVRGAVKSDQDINRVRIGTAAFRVVQRPQ